MSAGTDTSATAIEWVMLHLVLDPTAQERLYKEVVCKVGMDKSRKITEAEGEGMTYLQVVKETLRRHPPSQFMLSHAVTHDTELAGDRRLLGLGDIMDLIQMSSFYQETCFFSHSVLELTKMSLVRVHSLFLLLWMNLLLMIALCIWLSCAQLVFASRMYHYCSFTCIYSSNSLIFIR